VFVRENIFESERQNNDVTNSAKYEAVSSALIPAIVEEINCLRKNDK